MFAKYINLFNFVVFSNKIKFNVFFNISVHFYSYFYNLWKPDKLPRSRFASEYGIQSLPSIESFTSIALPNDLSIGSQFLRHRQHHAGGYLQMLIQIAQNLPSIKSSDLETFIYLSQVRFIKKIYENLKNLLIIGEGLI